MPTSKKRNEPSVYTRTRAGCDTCCLPSVAATFEDAIIRYSNPPPPPPLLCCLLLYQVHTFLKFHFGGAPRRFPLVLAAGERAVGERRAHKRSIKKGKNKWRTFIKTSAASSRSGTLLCFLVNFSHLAVLVLCILFFDVEKKKNKKYFGTKK